MTLIFIMKSIIHKKLLLNKRHLFQTTFIFHCVQPSSFSIVIVSVNFFFMNLLYLKKWYPVFFNKIAICHRWLFHCSQFSQGFTWQIALTHSISLYSSTHRNFRSINFFHRINIRKKISRI